MGVPPPGTKSTSEVYATPHGLILKYPKNCLHCTDLYHHQISSFTNCMVKAWAESESELQRSFISYTMRRFQKNPSARRHFHFAMYDHVFLGIYHNNIYIYIDHALIDLLN